MEVDGVEVVEDIIDVDDKLVVDDFNKVVDVVVCNAVVVWISVPEWNGMER